MTDELAHSERQFLLISILAVSLMLRFVVALPGWLPWTTAAWLALAAELIAVFAWLTTLPETP